MPSGRRASAAVTIAEVATLARVSTATVSRVMAGGAGVSAELTARVQSATRQLGYRPSALARGLASGRSRSIGVLVPDLANPYFHGLLAGFEKACAANGFRLVVSASGEDPDSERDIVVDLRRQSDGVLLCSPRMPRRSLERLVEPGSPVVVANRQVPGLDVATVCVDSYTGTLDMARHLVSLGHERVVYLSGPASSWSNRRRRQALRDAGRLGLGVDVVRCGSTMDDGYRAVVDALSYRPSALLAFNDVVAFGALARLREQGVAVPAELSVAGFDDISFAAYAAPALTTVHNPAAEVGRASWEALSAQLEGEGKTGDQLLTATLVVRASTGRRRAL
jgi:LacI family transcriptional regulator